MKKYLLVFCLALLSFTQSSEPVDRLGVKGPLTFGETSFGLSWSEHPNDFYYIQEYLPKGETSSTFTQMLTLHVFDKKITAEAAMRQKVKELELRKKTDPVCNYQVNVSPDGKEYIVDCLLSQSQGDKLTIVEFNAYRYTQIPLGANKTGILVYAYSKRSYGDAVTNFLKQLGDDRAAMLHTMMYAIVPPITITN
ncbi:hypothetical protein [Flavobacterium sp.]|uniref:hypothetical protein n=1 Tax=Flavobacterium sp. TaxID=239 RepID=UPI002FD9250E